MSSAQSSPLSRPKVPLFVQILIGLALGIVVGLVFKEKCEWLKEISREVLKALRLLATPLIFLSLLLAVLRLDIGGKRGLRLVWLIATNTLVAITIGLLVANLFRPGDGANLPTPTASDHARVEGRVAYDVKKDLLTKIIPESIIEPFRSNDILPLILLAILGGLALRKLKATHAHGIGVVESLADTFLHAVMVILHWLFYAVPFAVFGVVAATVGKEGLGPLTSMGKFVLAVLLALGLQFAFYLARVRMGSWVRPKRFFQGAADALSMAFSTASSSATLPVSLRCARDKIGVREESANLGVIVGGNLNNDGTALYEAMAALFIAQALGQSMDLSQQLLLVVLSIVASCGAAGIPEAGLVTMMAVFTAVKLPIDYIPLLLPVDWFLDRCRTMINVSGDLSVSCLLDGKEPQSQPSSTA